MRLRACIKYAFPVGELRLTSHLSSLSTDLPARPCPRGVIDAK